MKSPPLADREPLQSLSVVIPARNEEGCIAATIEHLHLELSLQGIPHEIVVVDDGSTDGTWALLQELHARIPECKPIQNLGEHGFGRAVAYGFAHMTGDAVVVMMADESDDCRDVVRYWRTLSEGWDAVFGSRFVRGGGVIDYPRHKLLLNRMANLFRRRSPSSAAGLKNFSMLASHVLVPPAIRALLSSPRNRVQGFIGPGHVCTVMGYREYEDLIREFHVPIVVGGFEPLDLLEAILMLVTQLEEGRAVVENQYVRSVTYAGNPLAQKVLAEVFEVCDRKWRGIGEIAESGFRLREEYAEFDADRIFGTEGITADEPAECISAEVLQGLKKPCDCSAFGTRCTPEAPLGAPMVSSEGACAAYYHYRRHAVAHGAR